MNTRIMNILYFLYIADYFLLAGQAAFYLLCFKTVFARIPASEFIHIRKLADPILQLRLSVIYYSSLLLGITIVIMTIFNGDVYAVFINIITFLLLVVDVVLAKRYNIPINTIIRETAVLENDHATVLQMNWLKWIGIRGVIIITGFIILIAGVVF